MRLGRATQLDGALAAIDGAHRLGVAKADTQSRLRSYVAWDFELRGNPSIAKEVDRIVDAVYRRSGPGPGAPTLFAGAGP